MNKPLFYTAVFVLLILVMYFAGRFIKKLPLNIVKVINWISFSIMIISGILWYLKGNEVYQYLLFGSIIIYFLFYNYDSKKG